MSGFQDKHVAAMVVYIILLGYYVIVTLLYGDTSKYLDDPKIIKTEYLITLITHAPFYYTAWNMTLQIIFLFTAILDVLAMLSGYPMKTQIFLGRTRSAMFNGLVAPVGLTTFTLFWTLFIYDRELVLPECVDQILKPWMNHTLHTVILLPIVIEFMLPKKHQFVSFGESMRLLVVFVGIYNIIFYNIYFRDNKFLYPIFHKLSLIPRIIFSVFVCALHVFYTQLGVSIQKGKFIPYVKKVF